MDSVYYDDTDGGWLKLTKGDLFASMNMYYKGGITVEDAERVVYTVAKYHMEPTIGESAMQKWLSQYGVKQLAEEWMQSEAFQRMHANTTRIMNEMFTMANSSYYYGISIEEARKILWNRFLKVTKNDTFEKNPAKYFEREFRSLRELSQRWFETDAVKGMKNADILLFRAFALLRFLPFEKRKKERDAQFTSVVFSLLWFWYASDLVRFLVTHPKFLKDRFDIWGRLRDPIATFIPQFTQKHVSPQDVQYSILQIEDLCQRNGGPETDRDSSTDVLLNVMIITPIEAKQPRWFPDIDDGQPIHVF